MRKRDATAIGYLIVLAMVISIIRTVVDYWKISLPIGIAIGFACIAFLSLKQREKEKKIKAIDSSQIDRMDGIEFENYVGHLLRHKGYSAQVTKASSDYGVDVIASKGNDKYAIQVKRYKSNVSRKAVSDAIGGMAYYNCNKSMVITNSYFSKSAVEMAKKTKCRLVDRDELADWVNDYTHKK